MSDVGYVVRQVLDRRQRCPCPMPMGETVDRDWFNVGHFGFCRAGLILVKDQLVSDGTVLITSI